MRSKGHLYRDSVVKRLQGLQRHGLYLKGFPHLGPRPRRHRGHCRSRSHFHSHCRYHCHCLRRLHLEGCHQFHCLNFHPGSLKNVMVVSVPGSLTVAFKAKHTPARSRSSSSPIEAIATTPYALCSSVLQ